MTSRFYVTYLFITIDTKKLNPLFLKIYNLQKNKEMFIIINKSLMNIVSISLNILGDNLSVNIVLYFQNYFFT